MRSDWAGVRDMATESERVRVRHRAVGELESPLGLWYVGGMAEHVCRATLANDLCLRGPVRQG